MYLGIDIGSSSTKAAIVNENGEIVALVIKNQGTGTKAEEEVIREAMDQAGVTREMIRATVATGYGRTNYEGADRQITEISCHARGVLKVVGNDVRTIVDIGGQDAKVILLNSKGKASNFVMNEKCAAGTGRFVEVMARVLAIDLSELSDLADTYTHEIGINNTCTVFAESEVISRLASGESRADVAHGAYVAIAKRVAGMCQRVGYAPKVVMTGGVALSGNLVEAMSKELKCEVSVAPYTQAIGAIGAAMYAYEIEHPNVE